MPRKKRGRFRDVAREGNARFSGIQHLGKTAYYRARLEQRSTFR